MLLNQRNLKISINSDKIIFKGGANKSIEVSKIWIYKTSDIKLK